MVYVLFEDAFCGENPALSDAEIALISLQQQAGYYRNDPTAVPSPELLDWLTA